MTTTPLYRAEAVAARHVKWHGEIILVRPISFAVLTFIGVFFALSLGAVSIWGTYTKRMPVSGELVPDTGLIKIYASQTGIVLEKHVIEGQKVNQGDVLYVLSSDRQSSTQGNTQAAISTQVEARRQSLHDELDKTIRLQSNEHNDLANKIDGLKAELSKLDNQMEGQRSRVKLAEESFARFQSLLSQGFISKEQLQQKQADFLDQRNRLQDLERDHIKISRDLTTQQNELTSLPLRQQNQLAQITRSIDSAGQELTESEAKRRLVITAPESGIATAVVVDVGQVVDSNRPLLTIVPSSATLQAQLFAPSKAIGFIKPGDQVLLRYQAFPYQKFGHAVGTVISISKIALPGNELKVIGAGAADGEPLYRITVQLAAQTVTAFGTSQVLQAGMLVDADVLQEKRRLYEWVLEPLYSLTGKL
jgi:membrane fusion protein